MSELKLTDREWKSFKIGDLFEIFTGKDLILSNIEAGKYPIVSHSDRNNGIQAFSKEIPNNRLFKHNKTISLADRGTFKAYVQAYDFYIGTRVKALVVRDNNVSKKALYFVSNQINAQSELFSYGRNACQRLEALKIMLPIAQTTDTLLRASQPASQPASQIGLLWKTLSSKKRGQKSGRLQIC